MMQPGFAIFDTAIGRCGIAWGSRGVVAVQLPEARDSETRTRLRRRVPEAVEAAPPAAVRRAINAIEALLRGEASDLSAVALDQEGVPDFHRRVYAVARTIPAGATLTYGAIAARLGAPGSARAVGQALGRNPFAIVVPCHRVVAAGGKSGGFSANGGVTTKLRLLAIERAAGGGVTGDAQGGLFDGDGRFDFDPDTAVAHLRAADPVLARLIDKVGRFRMELKQTATLFGALAEAIVYQQLSGKAAATIYGRVCALFPRAHGGPTAAHILRASDAELRGAGLSRAKLLALRDLAQRASARQLPTLAEAHGMDDASIIERLTAVRGIGRWTAEMMLMFRLGRPDVLPADDYGVRKGFALTFKKRELPTRQEMEKRGALWQPYRSVASWYLWRALDQ
ncbi:MAG: methylated-DNA--[protein]-cysteine S-methyltransferase [bacterium]